MIKYILLTGVPGTGKTAVGDHLQKNYGFTHYDFEDMPTLNLFSQDKSGFITKALTKEKVVISWGFMPYHQAEHVLEIKRRGFSLVWFDGNRVAAFREFTRRGTVSEAAFLHQMSNITSSKVVDIIRPRIINPFDQHGEFRMIDEITKEVLSL